MPSPRSLLQLVAHILPLVSLASSLHIKDRAQKRNETVPTTYYGVSSAEHEAKSSALKASGHRPLSLSLYGSPPEVKYAAVWVQEEGSGAIETIQTGDKASFDSWIQGWKAKGYVSTHVSATGSSDNAAYAGVMQQMDDVANWMQECDLTSPYAFENATGGIDMLIKGVSMYGSATSPLYCILGHENVGNQQQTSFYSLGTYKYNYAEVYAAETLKRYWRPTFIDVAGDGTLTPLFDDTSVGKWVAEVDLSEAQLASKIAEHAANGLSPIHLQGGGESSNLRYAAIFAEHSTPFPRRWTATGPVTGFEDNAAVTSALDTTMRAYMTTNGVRQAQVAASINGTLIASRAYTWAEPDRATVTPSHQFLLASISKMFTHAATQVLIDEGYLNTSTPIYPLLGLTPSDPRANDITVNDLLFHTAGYDRSVSPDLGFVFTQVAQSKNSAAPASLRDVIDWVLARPLDYAPGTSSAYSNFGTMLLTYAIEQLTETPYLDFLKEKVLNNDPDMPVDLYTTAATTHTSDPIVQETKYTSTSALTPLDETHKAPAVYGGDGAVKEEAVGAFGLKASAETIARFIGTHAVWGIGGRQTWYTRDGTLAGARAFAESQAEIDWALTMNTREYVSEEGWNRLTLTDLGSSVFMQYKTL